MVKQLQLSLSPAEAADDGVIRKKSSRLSGISEADISGIRIIKRSVDARKKDIRVNLSVEVLTGEAVAPHILPFTPRNVLSAREAIIVGAGPADIPRSLSTVFNTTATREADFFRLPLTTL